jgi:hypothetical protein
MLNKLLYIVKLLIFFFILTENISLFAFSLIDFKENMDENAIYSIKLNNGDIVSGNIVACINSIYELNLILNNKNSVGKDSNETFVPFIVINTLSEEIFIYEDEIMNIIERPSNDNIFQWQNHSLFLMPTANPISNKHFIGNYELFFIYGGIGIFNYLSISAGYSFIPFTNTNEQIAVINAKLSIPQILLSNINANIAFAVGANYAQINTKNKLTHIFSIATYNSLNINPANISIAVFYKAGQQEFPSTARLFEREFTFDYQDGAFGICGGFEKHFNTRKDLSLLCEVWNADVTTPTNTAILVGLRLAGSNIYADFGLSVFTTPFVAPFFSFVWMPFAN